MSITWYDLLFWSMHAFTATLFLCALLANFIPVIPSTLVSLAAIVLHRLVMGAEASVTWTFIGWMFLLFLISQALDYACTWWGAKRFGATWKGALGAILGGLFGMIFLGIPGIFLGPLAGAFLFEWLNFRTKTEALHAGIGTLLGTFIAMGLKMALTVVMIFCFYYTLGTT